VVAIFTVPGQLLSNLRISWQLPIKSFGFSRPMLQLPFFGLPTQLVHAANHIQQLSSKVLPRESFGSPNRSLPGKRSLRYYANQTFGSKSAGFSDTP
jgi:hypothetical protein